MKRSLFVSFWASLVLSAATAYATGNLSLQNLTVSSGQVVTHMVDESIQTASSVTVQSGGELNLTAGSRITIGPGFHAQSNSRVVLRAGQQYSDSDGDGMDNLWELQNSFSPHNASDASQDADGDGLTNLEEFRLRTNPRQAAAPDAGGTQTDLKIFVPHK